MVAKASAKTPPRQRSKFSAIFDALVAAPQVKTSPLPEVRRTAVAKTPDEEFYDLLMLRDPDAFGTPE